MSDASLAFAALHGLPTPLAVVGRDGVLRLCNPAWTAPGSPMTELAGRTLSVGDSLLLALEASARTGADVLMDLVTAVVRGEREAGEVTLPPSTASGPTRLVRVAWGRMLGEGLAVVALYPLEATPRQEPAEEAIPEGQAEPAPGEPSGAARAMDDPAPEGRTGSADVVVSVASADLCRLEWVSPSYEAVFGRPAAGLERDPRDFLLAVHPHDRERLRDGLWRQAAGTWNEVFRVVHRPGDVRWVRSRAFPVRDRDGVTLRVVCVSTDVTGQRQASGSRRDDRYRGIFAASPVGLALLDSDGTILETNPALAAIVGGPEPGVPVGNLMELLDEHDRVGALDALSAIAAGEPAGWAREVVLHLDEPTGVAVRLQISPLQNRDDGVRAVLVVEDVSDHRRLQQQLRQAQRIDSVGRLAGGVAHDFNNIMTVIQGHTDLMLGALAEQDPLHEDLERIREAADRAAALTGDLLAFSRRKVLKPRLLDLNEVVSGIREILGRTLGEDVELRIEGEPDLGFVRADPAQLEQVLLNLAMNSRDAMPKGGRLTIRTFDTYLGDEFVGAHLGSIPGPHVAVEVADTGTGMDEVTLGLVFEPFFTTKDPGKGTGLGLAMTYGIVKQSGGYIDIRSAPGEGTTVTIYLPRARMARPSRETPAAAGRFHGTSGGTILVAEDEPGVRALAARVLEQQGYDVLTAESGRDALMLSRAHVGPIDLLLTDVVMPGMWGPELAERLQSERPGIRVLFTTGYADERIVRQGLGERDLPFLAKPFSPSELGRRVNELLEV